MKVLHAMAGASVGGAETFFVNALKAINEEKIDQFVITRNNNRHKMEEIEKCNIPLKNANFSRMCKWPTKKIIQNSISEFNPDIIHHWMGRAGMFSTHGDHTNIGWYGGYYKPERFNNCHHHVAVTKDIADHIIREGIDSKFVHVLHIYAEFEAALPLNRAEFNTPNNVPLLLSLSRLHTKKGLDILLEAMTKIPDAYLWIAGSGPLKQELEAQMHTLNLEERVRFLGWRYDREALLATADICVFPSRYEPFGAIVIEALATGTPLIVTKASGPKAYVTHEENGLLINVDDVGELAASVNRVINDKMLQAHIVINGIEHYERYFTKSIFKKNVTDLYDMVKR